MDQERERTVQGGEGSVDALSDVQWVLKVTQHLSFLKHTNSIALRVPQRQQSDGVVWVIDD